MSLRKELIFLILQFCDEEDLEKTTHVLEEETGIFFDMMHFENLVLGGNWDEAKRYLLGFIGIHNDKISIKIYFEIRKQKFLEALDHDDRVKALDILLKDLKVFTSSNEELYKEMTLLLTLRDFRTHNSLTLYGDTMSARKLMMEELQSIIEAYPPFQQKLKFPEINRSRLRHLINQSLNLQHINCIYPRTDPEMKTLFIDHQCQLPDHSHGQSTKNNALPSKDTSALVSPFSGTSNFNPSRTETLSPISDGVLNPQFLTNPDVTSDSTKETVSTAETRSVGMLNEAASASTFPNQSHNSELTILDDFPKTVGWNLEPGSSPTTVDFHPIQHNLLLGVAYSKHIVHLYSYHSDDNNIDIQLEIEAHVGGVNDLAFSKPNEQLYVITCGDDKLIKVWDVTTGVKQYVFEGHEAPVYSICSHVSNEIHFGTSKNKFLAAGDEHLINVWDINNVELLATIDADGELVESPHIRFNNNGTFLAVFANHNIIKILANSDGLQLTVNPTRIAGGAGAIDGGIPWEGSLEKVWDFNVIDGPSQLQSLRLHSEMAMNNRLQRLPPQLCLPKSGLPMTNDLSGVDFKKDVACFAFLRNYSYFLSAYGGAVSFFDTKTHRPQDNNIIAVGMEDSTIILYKFPDEVKIINELKAHSNGITSLIFGRGRNVLVSSDSDAQVVLWDSIRWKKKKNRMMQKSVGWLPPSETYLQFYKDETHFLAVHDTHLAIYETTELKHVNQLDVGGFPARISHATFSCDGHLVYASFHDGTLLIFSTSDLHVKCKINPSAYLPSHISWNMSPFAVAAYPRDPNQIALGLTDSGVVIIHHLESDGQWDLLPPVDNETVSSRI
ncbi:hypothetical protein LguiA_030293 [Lonicera macranthoides]